MKGLKLEEGERVAFGVPMFREGLRDNGRKERKCVSRLSFTERQTRVMKSVYTSRASQHRTAGCCSKLPEGGKMRRRAKARLLCSLTREFNGREDEKTNEKEEREAAGALARHSACVLSLSLFLPRLSRARDASNDGNRTTIQIASNSRREQVELSHMREFVSLAGFVFPRCAVSG